MGRRTPLTGELIHHDVDVSWWVTPEAYDRGHYVGALPRVAAAGSRRTSPSPRPTSRTGRSQHEHARRRSADAKSRTTRTGWRVQPDGVAELVHAGHQVARAGRRRRRLAVPRRRVRRGRRDDRADRRRGVRRGRPDRQGQGADPGRVPPLPARPAAVHLPAPGGRPRADRVPAGAADRLDRLRDRADRRPQAAAAHPDERGGRPDGRAGRRARPGEPGRRRRASCSAACPAPRRRRSPSSAAACPAPRRRRSRSGMRAIVRVFDTNPAGWPTSPTSSADGWTWSRPNRARHRRLRRRVRRGDRRGAGARRQGAEAGHPGDDRQHAPGQRRRRHRHRPGRLLRDQPAHHAFRPDLRRGGRRALLRGEHPRRGRPHLHPRPDLGHPALPGQGRRRTACAGAAAADPALRLGPEHARPASW